jgi:beta-lactam-binding protein with PASTA domain
MRTLAHLLTATLLMVAPVTAGPGVQTGYERAQQRAAVQQPPMGRDASGNVKVPNLFRMTRAQAEATLKRYGFERGVSIDTSMCGSVADGKIVEKGEVCYQSPPPGNVTSPRVPVRIRVQDESPYGGVLHGERRWFLMPDMIGWPADRAVARLKELGVTKEVKIGYTKDCAANTVCKSLPEQLTRGDTTSDKLLYVGQP